MIRAFLAWLVLFLPVAAYAGPGATVSGKVDLPSTLPDRPPMQAKGFLERTENQLAPLKPANITGQMIIVLEGNEVANYTGQVVIELLGESFSRRVVGAPAGAEVVIKNLSKTARTLSAAEDPKLVPSGPINPTGPKSFRIEAPGKVYTIGDKDAPHLKVKIVALNTPYYGYVDEAGRFTIQDVPPGSYKLKIWYADGWLQRPDDVVDVKGSKTEVNPKIAADAFGGAAGKK